MRLRMCLCLWTGGYSTRSLSVSPPSYYRTYRRIAAVIIIARCSALIEGESEDQIASARIYIYEAFRKGMSDGDGLSSECSDSVFFLAGACVCSWRGIIWGFDR